MTDRTKCGIETPTFIVQRDAREMSTDVSTLYRESATAQTVSLLDMDMVWSGAYARVRLEKAREQWLEFHALHCDCGGVE